MNDFIVVGAGSAGCVMARRLSEHGRVALIEAGPPAHRWDYRLHMPAALSQVLSSKWYNWHYESEPETCLDNRRLYCPRGKVMGGSSSINGMIFVRGNRGDFDRWSSEYGLSDWDYESCLYVWALDSSDPWRDSYAWVPASSFPPPPDDPPHF